MTWAKRLKRVFAIDIERCCRRGGNELRYDMTIEDPEVLLKPWMMPTRVLPLSGRETVMAERANCELYEEGNETSQVRH